jgi:hypothetical protein
MCAAILISDYLLILIISPEDNLTEAIMHASGYANCGRG